MELMFNNFKDASVFASKLARVQRPSPVVQRRGINFAVTLPDRIKASLTKESITVATAIACLAAGYELSNTPESDLVMDAIRRTSSDMATMSDSQIGDYVQSLSPEALQGFASNVKGVYHELSYVDAFNSTDAGSTASVFSSTNNPGADVYFTSNGDVVSEIQLKATDSVSAITGHIENYPDIQIFATEEIASKVEGVLSSGFSNAELTADVSSTLSDLADPSLLEQAGGLVIDIASALFEWIL